MSRILLAVGRSWTFIAGALIALIPVQEAKTCSLICPSTAVVHELTETVAADGVLVFRPQGGLFPIPFENTSVEVRDQSGSILEGTFEEHGRLWVWRPSCLLEGGAEILATFTISEYEYSDCADFVVTSSPIHVSSEILTPLTVPSVCYSNTYEYEHEPMDSDNVACCDGGFPTSTSWAGSCDGNDNQTIVSGYCRTVEGRGYAVASFAWAPSLEDLTATNTIAQIETREHAGPLKLVSEMEIDDGQRRIEQHGGEREVRLRLTSLATGESVIGPWLAADAGADEGALGQITSDQSEAFEAACMGPAYRCQAISAPDHDFTRIWDLEDCEDYVPGIAIDQIGPQDPLVCTPVQIQLENPPEDVLACPPDKNPPIEEGCGCATSETPHRGFWGLMLLALLMLRRRLGREAPPQ